MPGYTYKTQKDGWVLPPMGTARQGVNMTDDHPDIKTYSLAEVAEMVLPPEMTTVAPS